MRVVVMLLLTLVVMSVLTEAYRKHHAQYRRHSSRRHEREEDEDEEDRGGRYRDRRDMNQHRFVADAPPAAGECEYKGKRGREGESERGLKEELRLEDHLRDHRVRDQRPIRMDSRRGFCRWRRRDMEAREW